MDDLDSNSNTRKPDTDETIYDRSFYQKYLEKKQYKYDHKKLARGIQRVLKPTSAVDLGCGSAQILYFLQKPGGLRTFSAKPQIKGYEQSPAAAEFWHHKIKSDVELADCIPSTIDGPICQPDLQRATEREP